MKKLIPNSYQESIYKINYKKLHQKKIKCLLFDLDNTCVGYKEKQPTQELANLFTRLKKDFTIIIFSNSPHKRLLPFNTLGVYINPSSKKPFTKNFYKVMNKYGLKKEEVCIIGDQLFTDIYGGNKVGIHTILVNPLTTTDLIFTKILRGMEQAVFLHLKRKKILIKGVYYE